MYDNSGTGTIPDTDYKEEPRMEHNNIAQRLTDLRAAKGATQEAVAQELKVSNKTVSKWETGASLPDLDMLVALARYYGVSTDALLGIAEPQERSVEELVRAEFRGLDRKEVIRKNRRR